ncbi:unnamed protein product [Symbiodinium sp. CCMP2592]|nr:unnamed protein product [Symbiodinium sp. CCMP2592]
MSARAPGRGLGQQGRADDTSLRRARSQRLGGLPGAAEMDWEKNVKRNGKERTAVVRSAAWIRLRHRRMSSKKWPMKASSAGRRSRRHLDPDHPVQLDELG